MAGTLPYVKFSRGTPLAYQNLKVKNNDTLYFITDTSTSESKLYLGNELISAEISKLSDLKDLIISAVGEKDLLVYDGEHWVNKSVAEAIGIYQGATADNPGVAGLVPAAAAGQGDYFLSGDGTWKQVTAETPVAATQVFEATPVDEESHIEALTRIVGATALQSGDIGIVKVLIYGDKYEYTAYVYDGENWKAMDGNYSAENVYFNSDFTFTEKIGTVQTLTNGSATVEAKGKSVKDFLAGLFAAPKNPTVTQPSVSISMSGAGTKEVGTQVTPSYSVTFNKGSYSYGPDTGITPTYSVTDSNSSEAQTGATGSFSALTIGDDTDYTVTVTASYEDGAVPVDNLGNEKPELKIKAGSKSASASTHFKGFRKTFYGTTENKTDTVDSTLIRNLAQSSSGALVNGSEFTINIPVGAMRVIFAYPATLRDASSVLDVNGMNAQIVGSFSQNVVSVEGVNNYEGIDYKVYVFERAAATTETNTYKVKI